MSNSPERILVVDDEQVIRDVLSDFLSMEGFEVTVASDGEQALDELSRNTFDVVLSDLKMPKVGGLELLQAVKSSMPTTAVVIMTGFGTVESALDAIKRGAYDYILKPFKVDEVVLTIRRAGEKQRLESENIRLREALSLYKVSEAIAASLSLDAVLRTICNAAIHELGADQVKVVLEDGEGGYFERESEIRQEFKPKGKLPELMVDSLVERLRDEPFLLLKERAKTLCEQEGASQLPSSLIATPLRMRGKLRGFLVVLSYDNRKMFDEGQRKVISMVGNRAAAAIENANLYEDLRATFHQTIEGLASAIDKMDRYTAGHSERVAAYAQLLAIKLDLSEEMVEIVRQSALMHDIGKIGCVINLNKPGKLSQAEYDVFKLHPGYGKDILDPISFLHPLIPGVYSHHERWDGEGYPLGLTGQDIPLVARIVAVADTYDAMTSDRAYRKALPHDVAVKEIQRCCGEQFDPECATEFHTVIEEHQGRMLDEETG